MINLQDIVQAKYRISKHIHQTPLMYSETLSEDLNVNIYLKLESLQKTGAFKIRGVLNKILSTQSGTKKFITASSGNHGLGLAYASKMLGLDAVVVVPEYTPNKKVQGIKRLGAQVILKGKNWNESYDHCLEISGAQDYVPIHPFEDLDVIAGQGTMALEILDQLPDNVETDFFLASIGGGSMISSNALVYKTLSPKTRVFGLQSPGADAMYQSRCANGLISLDTVDTTIESFATKVVSQATFELTQKFVDDIFLIDPVDCRRAVMFMLERTNILIELSAAINIAAVKKRVFDYKPSDTIVMTLCGGNYNFGEMADDLKFIECLKQ